MAWRLDAYVPVEAVGALRQQAERHDADPGEEYLEAVLLRVVDGPWPFPPNYQLAPQPLAALDLLENPDPTAHPRTGQHAPQPSVGDGDPRSDTPAAAAHMLGVLWASASPGATVKELRAALALTRERLEAAYAYLLAYPLPGLTVLRHGDEIQLVTTGQVAASVERHLNAPRPVSLSGAAMQVLTIVAYRQPVSQAGIESARGTSSDRAIGALLQRQFIALDEHRLFTTTPAFLKYLGLRDLADLPPLPDLEVDSLDWISIRQERAASRRCAAPSRGTASASHHSQNSRQARTFQLPTFAATATAAQRAASASSSRLRLNRLLVQLG
jgi:segregation and condensation protein B